MWKIASVLTFLAFVAVAPPAMAKKVYLNGVDISELRSKTFKDATVYIDENGNVYIDAPKYKVKVVDEASASQIPARNANGGPNPALTNKYFLVTTPSSLGRAQYKFVLTINGVERKVIKAASSQVIIEISAWLKKGTNHIALTAKKDISGGRKSFSPTDESKVLVGKGYEAGATVKIEAVYLSLKVNASQTVDVTKHYTLEAK